MFVSAMVGDILTSERPDLLPLPGGFFCSIGFAWQDQTKPEIPQGEQKEQEMRYSIAVILALVTYSASAGKGIPQRGKGNGAE